MIQFHSYLHKPPQAIANMRGSGNAIRGTVSFRQTPCGVLVTAQICGLPRSSGIFGFHIHEGCRCTGTADDPFRDADGHYNPHGKAHPYHAGDMPPLFGANGRAFSAFLTDRFTIDEIGGLTVIIHDSPDDFTTQPAGNSGKKIACGQIRRLK